MGDVGEAFEAFDEDKRRQRAKIEPKRIEFAMKQFDKIGVRYLYDFDKLEIFIENGQIDFWPFTGWFCGRKPIGNVKGRGIKKLILEISKLKG